MNIDIEKIIDDSIKADQEDREINSWHISKLGSCLRGVYYERLGVEPDKPFDARTLRVFDVGNQFEDWIVKRLGFDKSLKIETQERVEDKELNISGRIDALVTLEDEQEIWEFKTKHSRAFWYMTKEGKPMRQHEYQLFMYLFIKQIKKGRLVYISKDDLCIQQFFVSLDDAKLRDEVFTQINLLNSAWKAKDPSLLPLPDDKDWQAKYCRFHSRCKNI